MSLTDMTNVLTGWDELLTNGLTPLTDTTSDLPDTNEVLTDCQMPLMVFIDLAHGRLRDSEQFKPLKEYRSVYVFPKTVIYGCTSQLNAFNASTKKLACTTKIVWYNAGNIFYNTEGKEITYWIFADQVLGCCIDAVLLHNLGDTSLHSYTDKNKRTKCRQN